MEKKIILPILLTLTLVLTPFIGGIVSAEETNTTNTTQDTTINTDTSSDSTSSTLNDGQDVSDDADLEENEDEEEDDEAIEEDVDEDENGDNENGKDKQMKKLQKDIKKLEHEMEKALKKVNEKAKEQMQRKVEELKQNMEEKWLPLLEELSNQENTEQSIQATYEYVQSLLNQNELTEEEQKDAQELMENLEEELKGELEGLEEVEGLEDIELPTSKIEAYKQLMEMYKLMDKDQDALEAQEQILGFTKGSKDEAKKLIELYKETNKKELKAFVNGKQPQFDVPPQLVNGNTLVPFRAIAEALGAEVSYDPETRTITVKQGDVSVSFVLNQKQAKVNGQIIQLQVPATTVNGNTVVPLRFISESLGADVEYDSDTQLIFVDNQDQVTTEPSTETTTETQPVQ
ncbi:MAG: stalk domain-containing protein [Tepidibacillus sp.]